MTRVPSGSLGLHDLAEARHRAYALFGQGFLLGMTEEAHARLAALPAMADVLVAPSDEAAAAHHEALALGVFPYEGVFVDESGLLGGPAGASVSAAYAEGGFRPATTSTEPDHLGLELAFLAHLSAAEADARADRLPDRVDEVCALQRRFLDQHVLRWLPPFVVALEASGSCAWLERSARLALELAASHRGALGAASELDDLPLPTLDLDDANTRLVHIVDHLVRPAHAGLYLSRQGIAEVADAAGVPQGFGPRAKMLEQVLITAVEHRAVDRLVDALRDLAQRFDQRLQAIGDLDVDVDPWRTRLVGTSDVLDRMADAVVARTC